LKRQLELKKKNGKKGFTLIEVIVVIVILAILAAIAVPALTGYIDKAKDKELEADGHNIMVALQAIGTEAYTDSTITPPSGTAGATDFTAIEDLTGVDYSDNGGAITDIAYTGAALTGFKYTNDGSTKTLTYAKGTGFSVS
jgi:type IV pilus assembly protein PilA